jgi:hypothetical protein
VFFLSTMNEVRGYDICRLTGSFYTILLKSIADVLLVRKHVLRIVSILSVAHKLSCANLPIPDFSTTT